MPGTAGQPAGDANASADDPAQKPVEPYYPDPRGEPGVAEAAEAEAEAAKRQQQEALRAQADALDDEPVVDLNQDAGAPVEQPPTEPAKEPASVPAKAKAKS